MTNLTPPEYRSIIDESESYIKDDLARWVERHEAKTVPILYDAPWDVTEKFLSKLDGIAFTGGPLWTNQTFDTPFVARARQIYEYALKREPKLPLLAICQGFQMISMFAAEDKSILVDHVADFTFHPIKFLDAHKKPSPQSRVLQSMPAEIRHTLENYPAATNVHFYGIGLTSFISTPFSQKFNLVAVDVDANRDLIVGMVEHKTHPIIAYQFHPEIDPARFENGILSTKRDENISDALTWLASYFVELTSNARSERLSKDPTWDWLDSDIELLKFTPDNNNSKNKNWNAAYIITHAQFDYHSRYIAFPKWQELNEWQANTLMGHKKYETLRH